MVLSLDPSSTFDSPPLGELCAPLAERVIRIIGGGTRLYEGKHNSTAYDFVKAHHLFSDPEWDGESAEPEEKNKVCAFCNVTPCTCEEAQTKPCTTCGNSPCSCEQQDCEKCGKRPCSCSRRTKVKLADGKERSIQPMTCTSMTCTSFWHSSGRPMSSPGFLDLPFGQIPEFFKNEDELRQIWSKPDTRAKLLDGLAEKGFGPEQL
jgi:type I restriction enzyme R subunit